MTTRPVLGIICCTRDVGGVPAQTVLDRYVQAALRFADAAGLLVPALPALMRADEVAPRLDGLLLTGSPSNVSPAHYDPMIEDADGPFDPGRDRMVLDLVEAMTRIGKPVFGICRGFQELNVAFGGTLRRDMSAHPDLLAHHAPPDVGYDAMFAHGHDVTLREGGVLARALGRTQATVNSVHFQGVDRLGDGLTIEARAPDGVVEAFSGTRHGAPVLAVQWHPEWDTDQHPDSQAFFGLMGRVLRGGPLGV